MRSIDYLILKDREDRWYFQKYFINEDSNDIWIILRANMPGENKIGYLANYLCYFGFKEINNKFNIEKTKHYIGYDGLTIYFKVKENAKDAKLQAINIENEKLGRFIDIDILKGNNIISRRDLNIPRRKCYICQDDAIKYIKNRKHNIEDLINKIEEACTKYIFFENDVFSRILELSSVIELSRKYGYGCVTVFNNGSHEDMDILTFYKSIYSISKYFKAEKFKDIRNFQNLREYGKEIEKNNVKFNKGNKYI